MKKLILIIDKEKYFFDTIEEVIQMLLGDNEGKYLELPEKERLSKRYLKAYINQDMIVSKMKKTVLM